MEKISLEMTAAKRRQQIKIEDSLDNDRKVKLLADFDYIQRLGLGSKGLDANQYYSVTLGLPKKAPLSRRLDQQLLGEEKPKRPYQDQNKTSLDFTKLALEKDITA